MELSEQSSKIIHSDFKVLAQKSIGSSLSIPILSNKHKNIEGEEMFKVTVDKRVSELYYQLLQNRVNKLKREEMLEQKKNEIKKKLEEEKAKINERRRQEEHMSKSVKQVKQKSIEKIKESISKMKNYHFQLMNDIKTHSIDLCHQLNSERKAEKLHHLRIKSELCETSRIENSKKASKIRSSQRSIEEIRQKNWTSFKDELKTRYHIKIEQERREKSEYEKKMKALEAQEQALLQKLGKSQFTSVNSSRN